MVDYRLVVPSDDDIKIIYDWESSEPNSAYIAGKAVNPICDFEEYYIKFKQMLDNPKRPYKILVNHNKEVLGNIKGYNYLERNNSIVIGFYIPAIERNKGYGTKIVELFVNELFLNPPVNINRIIATTVETNEGSKKILEKNLFVLEGKLRENICLDEIKYTEYYYSILRNEWKEKNLTTAST